MRKSDSDRGVSVPPVCPLALLPKTAFERYALTCSSIAGGNSMEHAIESTAAPDGQRNSSTNTDSNRVIITKRAIFDALYSLMEERDFSKISVGDILERSGVSRTTFYRCFQDKYDVVNWSFKRFKEINPQFKGEYHSFATSLRVQLDYLARHQRYFAQALRYKGQNSLREAMYDVNEEYLLQCWREAMGPVDPDYPVRAAAQFTAAGMSEVLARWVTDGCAEAPDEVIRALCKLVPPQLMELLY
ncbi:TetR family transcriptional regulator [Eggerthellaceae bacterium zg-887]|nr:TetR family transcriptional regulator [Xiamenia xianingshaonis]